MGLKYITGWIRWTVSGQDVCTVLGRPLLGLSLRVGSSRWCKMVWNVRGYLLLTQARTLLLSW